MDIKGVLKHAGVGLLVLVAFVLLFQSARTSPIASGEAFGPNGTSGQPHLIPAQDQSAAPDFTLTEVQTGRRVHLADEVKDKPVVFSFWATYCGPCRMELPYLDAIAKKYQGRIAFYGVNASDTPASISAFTKQEGLTLPMLSDAQAQATLSYGVQTIPVLVIVNRKGQIVYVSDGYDPNMESYFPDLLDQTLQVR